MCRTGSGLERGLTGDQVMILYIPIWFQAIRGRLHRPVLCESSLTRPGASPVGSGIMNLPMILALVVTSMTAGGLVTFFGYYAPFVIASSVFMSIGAGLVSTFSVDVGSPKWIGYQIVFGVGLGFGMQQTVVAAQTVLPKADVPIGTAIVIFSQTLGGAIFISAAQNVFTNRLVSNLQKVLPDLNPVVVLGAGATSLKDVIPAAFLANVLIAYNNALRHTFYVSVALASLSCELAPRPLR